MENGSGQFQARNWHRYSKQTRGDAALKFFFRIFVTLPFICFYSLCVHAIDCQRFLEDYDPTLNDRALTPSEVKCFEAIGGSSSRPSPENTSKRDTEVSALLDRAAKLEKGRRLTEAMPFAAQAAKLIASGWPLEMRVSLVSGLKDLGYLHLVRQTREDNILARGHFYECVKLADALMIADLPYDTQAYDQCYWGLTSNVETKEDNLTITAQLKDSVVAFSSARQADYQGFATTLDLLANALSKADSSLAEPYNKQAVDIALANLSAKHIMIVSQLVGNYVSRLGDLKKEPEADLVIRRFLAWAKENPTNADKHVADALQTLSRNASGATAYELKHRSIEIWEGYVKANPQDFEALQELSSLYGSIGSSLEQPTLTRALHAAEKARGRNSFEVSLVLQSMSYIYKDQRNWKAVQEVLKRRIEIERHRNGTLLADFLIELAELNIQLAQSEEARSLLEAALTEIDDKGERRSSKSVTAMIGLGQIAMRQGNMAGAESYLREAESIEHSIDGGVRAFRAYNALLISLQRYDEAAERIAKAAVTDEDREYAITRYGDGQSELFSLHLLSGHWRDAVKLVDTSPIIAGGRPKLPSSAAHTLLFFEKALNPKAEAIRNCCGNYLSDYLRALHRSGDKSRASAERSFALYQAAAVANVDTAIQGMTARFAANTPELRSLVLSKETLGEQIRTSYTQYYGLSGATGDADRKKAAELLTAMKSAEAEERAVDAKLKSSFPRFFELISPMKVDLKALQKTLGSNEIVIAFVDAPPVRYFNREALPHELYYFVISARDITLELAPSSGSEIIHLIRKLKCVADQNGSKLECAALNLKRDGSGLYPFDLTDAHKLYVGLFGGIHDRFKDKKLIFVPQGETLNLPFHLLVTTPPANREYREAAWLIRSNATVVVPSVTSLMALRTVAPASAPKPYIGVGNPLLTGSSGSSKDGRGALAKERINCKNTTPMKVALLPTRAPLSPIKFEKAVANSSMLRQLEPLPETADELCRVRELLGAEDGDVYLGPRATETNLKDLSANGHLADFSVLHFATHGAISGEAAGVAEPGLILTPPAMGSEKDDGYLSGSEILNLRTNADWVVLSACNTGSGDYVEAEQLSGLARAFFFAGARSLLVSYWAVDSDSAVKITTVAFEELSANRTIGKAEAMRRSMIALIDKGAPQQSHPSYWAPFVLVGD